MTNRESEQRQKIVLMLKFIGEMTKQGYISDFSIFRSSLEQVYKRIVKQEALNEEAEKREKKTNYGIQDEGEEDDVKSRNSSAFLA